MPRQAYIRLRTEGLFWFAFLLWTLLPMSRIPWISPAGIPIRLTHVVLVIAAYLYLLAITSVPGRRVFESSPGAARLKNAALAVFAYAALSILWSNMTRQDAIAMAVTVGLSACALILGYSLVSGASAESVRRFLWRLTVALAAVGLLYSCESLFSLGLRGPQSASDFIIQRVKGPLFGAAHGHFILLPALGFAAQEMLLNRRRPVLKALVILSLLITIVGMGSRTALIMLGLFVLLVAVVLKSRRQRLLIISLLILTIGLAALTVFSKASSQRVMSLESLHRAVTLQSAWRTVSDRGIAANVIGSGYGSIWPWYMIAAERSTGSTVFAEGFIMSPGGPVAYHPHSDILMLVVELGVPGVAFFVALWVFLVGHLRFSVRHSYRPIAASALALSAASMFTNFFLFKLWGVAAIWWAFVFGSFVMAESGKAHEREEQDYRYSTQGGAGPDGGE